jgi:hypothetical protein
MAEGAAAVPACVWQMTSVVKEIYEDPKCFTTIVRPNGAFARSTNMKLGDYILV